MSSNALIYVHTSERFFAARVSDLADDAPVLARCAEIEASTWNPREDFLRAARRSHWLLHIEREGAVVGFFLLTELDTPDHFSVSIDEAMIAPAHQGHHLASRLFWNAACAVTDHASRCGAERVAFFALTANPFAILAFHKYRWLLPEHSFRPAPWQTRAAHDYLTQRGHAPLESSPFWARAAFGGCLKRRAEHPPLPAPPGFDCAARGDAFLMVGAVPTLAARSIALGHHALTFGRLDGLSVRLPGAIL